MQKPKTKMIKIPAKELVVHPVAQRKLVPGRLRKITDTLNLDALGVLHAVYATIDGVKRLVLVDGQHRWRSLMDLDLGEWEVDVMVHLDITTDKQAADLFLVLQQRSSVRAIDEFFNELTAGRPDTSKAAAIVERNGLHIDYYKGDYTVNCIGTIRKVFAIDGGPSLQKSLDTIVRTWGGTKESLEAKLIEGLGLIYAHYDGNVDRQRMMLILQEREGGAPSIVGDGRVLARAMGITHGRGVANAVISIYNKAARSNKLQMI